ncbi:uncharacterized protein LOC122245014 [Penaeus japonicus]|uniref:uncharacterized protein LOC122245014 n=1 Tax=Penaeus japonicus TaxID=27405 RepID=UPI001C713A9D|nr:uncharacterized protein LOC122245014 [Penaeus japonicus]
MTDNRLRHLGPDFPTLIHQNSATSPDIILSNRYGHFNHRIIPGNLTTGDHIPVIMDITTNPILIPTTPRPDYSNADWSKYKELLRDKPPIQLDGKPATEINKEMDKWLQDVLNTKRTCIPNKSFRTAPHPTNSPELQLLQTLYKGVRDLATIQGWTPELRRRHTQIRDQLVDISRAHHNLKWAELTTQLSTKVRDSRNSGDGLNNSWGTRLNIAYTSITTKEKSAIQTQKKNKSIVHTGATSSKFLMKIINSSMKRQKKGFWKIWHYRQTN